MYNSIARPRVISVQDLDHVTSHIASLMVTWKNSRIMVTGATGFFGQWLVETFHHANQMLSLGAELLAVGGPNDEFALICPLF